MYAGLLTLFVVFSSIFVVFLVVEILYYFYITFFLAPTKISVTFEEDSKYAMFKSPIDRFRDILDVFESISTYTFEKFNVGWCSRHEQVDMSDIYTENYDAFLSWALYVKDYKFLDDNEKNVIKSFREEACKRFNIKMKEGYNPKIRHVDFSNAPVTYNHHPLLIYGIWGIFEQYYQIVTLRLTFGFKKFNRYGISYWYKASSSVNSGPPILLFHGICSGWGYYWNLIKMLSLHTQNRSVILIDYPYTRFSWFTFDVPHASEFTDGIEKVLDFYGIKKCSVIGHSWGTMHSGNFVKKYPEYVTNFILIDPASLTVFLPETIQFLLYKRPTNVEEYFVDYMIRGNITIANTIQRHLLWYNAILLLKEVASHIPVRIFVGKNDQLIHYQTVLDLVRVHQAAHKNVDVEVTVGEWTHGWAVYDDECVTSIQKILLKDLSTNKKF